MGIQPTKIDEEWRTGIMWYLPKAINLPFGDGLPQFS
jgi:hypothetical protein